MADSIDCSERESQLNTLGVKKDYKAGILPKECLKKAVNLHTFNKISKKQFIWLSERGFLGKDVQKYARDLFWNKVWEKLKKEKA